jgi:transposase
MGGYERGVVEHLRTAGFNVLVLQPIQVKAFGRVHPRRAKNDALDAVLIATCAAASIRRGSRQIHDSRNWPDI